MDVQLKDPITQCTKKKQLCCFFQKSAPPSREIQAVDALKKIHSSPSHAVDLNCT